MALKGSAVIELTDVKTGKKEVVKHDNLITNAINDIISTDPLNLKWGNDTSQIVEFFPVVSQLIGGIVLFEDALEEDASKYYAPETNRVMGYSDMDVSPGADVKRGSLNQTESGWLDNNTGYRFVFDFSTSQGNGHISSMALTSGKMGACGYGSAEYNDYANKRKYRQIAYRDKVVEHSTISYLYQKFSQVCWIDAENGYAYSVIPSNTKFLEIYRFKLITDTVGLSTTAITDERKAELVTTLSTTSFLSTYASPCYAGFCDGGDGYIWGFQLASNASSNSRTVYWIKISKADWTFEEGSWSLSAAIDSPGYFYKNNTYSIETKCIVHNGIAYFPRYNYNGIAYIDTNNPTDKGSIYTVNSVYQSRKSGDNTLFNLHGDVISFACGYIADKKFYPAVRTTGSYDTYPGHSWCAVPGVRVGPYLYGIYTSSTSDKMNRVCAYLDTAYLATINNLGTPVDKTADKTMKITYILREE